MKKYAALLIILMLTGLFSCSKSDNSLNLSSGKGGSLARFTIAGNYLYTVDDYTLTAYDISDPEHPVQKSKQQIAWNIETIFPYEDKLFIGGQIGMYIYDITHPDTPESLGKVEHIQTCDPVVANDSVAFVTLRSATSCSVFQHNALYIYSLKDILNPKEMAIEFMDAPEGLGLKDSTLFVCDDSRIVVFNVKDPMQPVRTDSLSDDKESYHDVIPYNDILICMVDSGILLYDISNVKHIRQVGQIIYQ